MTYWDNRRQKAIARKLEQRRIVENRKRMRRYELTDDDYALLVQQQDEACAICRTSLFDDSECHIDHDHKTGKVRGLLCNSCNRALGYFKDDPKVLEAAIKYLEDHRKKNIPNSTPNISWLKGVDK